MPEPDDGELVSRILADDLDPAERLRVAQRLAGDAEFAAQVREHLRLAHLVHAGLAGGNLAERIRWQATERRGSRRHARLQKLQVRVQRRRSRRGVLVLFVTLGAAAAALALMLLPGSGPEPALPAAVVESGGDGRRELRRGETLDSGAAPCVLRLLHDAGSRLTLEPGSSLALLDESGPLPLFALRQGTLHCAAEAQQPDRPLIFAAGGSRSTVVGTAFTLRQAGPLAELQVEHGTVRFAAATGDPIAVGAGQGASSRDAGPAVRFFADRTLIDDGSGYTGCQWTSDCNPSSHATLTAESRQDGPGLVQRLSYQLRRETSLDLWAKIMLVTPDLDASSRDGFSFRLLGRGDGRTLSLGVFETSTAGTECWMVDRQDSRAGWQTIQVRWAELQRSQVFQPEQAPNDGFSPTRIASLYVQVSRTNAAGATDGELVICEPRWLAKP
jgi:hypothetical protein